MSLKIYIQAPCPEPKINVIQKVYVIDFWITDQKSDSAKVIEYDTLLDDGLEPGYLIVESHTIPEIGETYYSVFLADTAGYITLGKDLEHTISLAENNDCVVLENEPHNMLTDYALNGLKATHEIVATPLHVELYPPYTQPCVNGSVILKHERGHRLHAHYVDQSWLWHLEGQFKKPEFQKEYDGKKIHYFGYYDKGVFQIVDEYNTKIVDNNRHHFPKLIRH